jgi:hypothetical protein
MEYSSSSVLMVRREVGRKHLRSTMSVIGPGARTLPSAACFENFAHIIEYGFPSMQLLQAPVHDLADGYGISMAD